MADWQSLASAILGARDSYVEPESIAEVGELLAMYGDPGEAVRILAELTHTKPRVLGNEYIRMVQARVEIQRGNLARASEFLSEDRAYSLSPGFRSGVLSLRMQLAATRMRVADASIQQELVRALEFAERQQAWFWWKTLQLTRALVSDSETLNGYVGSLDYGDAAYMSIQAELVVRRLGDLNNSSLGGIRQEAERRPARWRWALRQLLSNPNCESGALSRAVELLELVGDADDIPLLREIAHRKALRSPDTGRALIRRLAPHVYVEDLGRLTIRVGSRVVQGTDIRRKVLSLLAFLLTRPQFTASREQVVEALWPEMAPEPGANSLNQTAYFLRRVFEPGADDDTSAGYLGSKGELIWLNSDLIQCRSSDCQTLITAARADPTPDLIMALAKSYTGRFALDFMYDDWACAFRESLHASYLDRIERGLEMDMKVAAYDRALSIAQLAMQADPEADDIELCLLRLYRLTGAHAAAAEQYVHYSALLREQLGVDPPPLESI